jgi:predicted deacylase
MSHSPKKSQNNPKNPNTRKITSMQIMIHALGQDSSGTRRELTSLHFGPGPGQQSGQKVYIQAALHADEIPGMLVACHLRSLLTQLEADQCIPGEIVLVPVANPIGLAQAMQGAPQGRFDWPSGCNFNRAFCRLSTPLIERLEGRIGPDPLQNRALIRETARQVLLDTPVKNSNQELKQCLQTLAIDADIVLDLHCDNEAVPHLYAGTHMAQPAEALGRWLGAEAILLAHDSGDEPFDEACSRFWQDLQHHFGAAVPLACFAATIELRGQVDVSDAQAAQDARAIVQFLAEQGHLRQVPPQPQPAARCQSTPLAGVQALHAPAPGVLLFHHAPGAELAIGDTVCELLDPDSGNRLLLSAQVAGKLFARTHLRYVQRGMDLAKIAGPIAFRSGNLLAL